MGGGGGGGGALNMYGRGPHRARRFCKECTKSCISYENALLSFGSGINLTTREKVSVQGARPNIII